MRVPRSPLLAALVVLSGCGNDKTVVPVVGAPIPCFTIGKELETDAACLYQYVFTLDASCSTDDMTAPQNLEVRWDFQNDGTWDTGFSTTKVHQSFFPDPTVPTWIARAEVRDSDGKTAETTRSLPLGPLPTAPDMVAGAITFRQLTGLVDTVRVNEDFTLIVNQTCYGDFPSWEARISRNGVLLDSLMLGCTGGVFSCGGGGRDGWAIGTPGTYQFSAVIDSDQEHAETNEGNNVALGTVVVVP